MLNAAAKLVAIVHAQVAWEPATRIGIPGPTGLVKETVESAYDLLDAIVVVEMPEVDPLVIGCSQQRIDKATK